MRETLDQLLALQEIDTAIREAEIARAALDDGAAAAAEVARLQERLEELKRALELASTDLKDKELALASVEEKKKAAEGRAYSGTVSNPRELEGLEKDIEQLTHQKDRLEDEVLELYDIVEKHSAALAEHTKTVQDAQERLARTREEYQARLSNLNNRLAQLAREREALVPTIDAAALRHYEAIRQRAKNLGIVTADGGVCSGCNVTLPSTTVKRLAQAAALLTCDNCGRILHPGKG